GQKPCELLPLLHRRELGSGAQLRPVPQLRRARCRRGRASDPQLRGSEGVTRILCATVGRRWTERVYLAHGTRREPSRTTRRTNRTANLLAASPLPAVPHYCPPLLGRTPLPSCRRSSPL